MPSGYASYIAFVFGAVFGSFLNVCIYRLPHDRSIVSPPSSCPLCGARIRFYDNIPLLSFILLRGRCRRCHGRISFQYPLVEALAGVSLLYLFLQYGPSFRCLIYFFFISSLLVVSFIDIRHQIIPNKITYPGIVAGLGASFLLPSITPIQSIIGILSGGLGLASVALLFQALRKKEGMGFGDVKLLAMIGAFTGWKGVIVTLVLASLAGAPIGYALLMLKRSSTQEPIPFGPFLSASATVYLLYGEKIISWYVGLMRPH